ncbi:response regulator [Zhongshania sp.]|uniref:response regulator n=1 Tax=Zhongshania sp. TaxID=1971902 RepID=UPI0035675B08
MKLMVVDDSNIIRSKICRAHDTDKFDIVAAASDGAEAIELFNVHRPQVVTMDLTMPNIDGIECIERLAALDPEVLILVVSALSDQATGIEALEKGASGFLLKPFSEHELRAALDELTEHLND